MILTRKVTLCKTSIKTYLTRKKPYVYISVLKYNTIIVKWIYLREQTMHTVVNDVMGGSAQVT